MKIAKCPRCGLKGFLTLRYTKYKDLRYLYVGHYNSKKKSKRSWCLLSDVQIKSLKIEKFWQYRYYELITEAVNLRANTDEIAIWIKPLKIAKKLLDRNGYSKIRIEFKLFKDLKDEETRKLYRIHYPLEKFDKDKRSTIKQRYEHLKSKLMKD
ncbi:MAG TPA: hypothetical protein VJ571_01675 [Candidatus Nitrosotalea sp.]|nr:hypothetical protein [Candidatus Nitrosotalea sp.]